MALTVELLGIPGSGKSTLLRNLLSFWVTQGSTAERRLLPTECAPELTANPKPLALISWLWAQTPRTVGLVRRLGTRDRRYPDLVEQSCASFPEFTDMLLQQRFDEDEAREIRLLSQEILSRRLIEFDQAVRCHARVTFLTEGGLLQAGARLLRTSNVSQAEAYFSIVPVPNVVVLLACPVETARRRIDDRGQATDYLCRFQEESWNDLLRRDARTLDVGLELLEQRAGLVLTLDAGRPSWELTREVADLLQEIS